MARKQTEEEKAYLARVKAYQKRYYKSVHVAQNPDPDEVLAANSTALDLYHEAQSLGRDLSADIEKGAPRA